MNVDLAPDEARRLTMLLADDVASDLARGWQPGGIMARITGANQVLLGKLQPACRWQDADPVARALAAGALAQAQVPGGE